MPRLPECSITQTLDPYRDDPGFERIVAALDLPKVEPPAAE
jgi:hypothetical protein